MPETLDTQALRAAYRTRIAEAIRDALRGRGFDALVYYQMD